MPDFLDPNNVINQLELREDMKAAEFGCGSGDFTIALAKKLVQGKVYVYGLDIQEEPLSALKGRAVQEGIRNIETIRCNLEEEGGSTLPDEFLDLVLIPNLLFQVEDKKAVIKEAKRILKKGAEIVIVDWKKNSTFGPKEGRIASQEVRVMAEELELKLKKEFEAGAYHYGLIFERP